MAHLLKAHMSEHFQAIVDRFFPIPRNTPSAARAMPSLLAGLSASTQRALRLLLLERIALEAKVLAMLDRVEAAPHYTEEPEAFAPLRLGVRDSDMKIRELAPGDRYAAIMRTLAEPEVIAAMRLAVLREEDAGSTALERGAWRHQQLATIGSPVALSSVFRYASHDSPNVRGHRDLHNRLNADPHNKEGRSFYERVTARYAPASVGDTAITSVWREVYSHGHMRPHAEPERVRENGGSSLYGGSSPRGGSVYSGSSPRGGSAYESFPTPRPSTTDAEALPLRHSRTVPAAGGDAVEPPLRPVDEARSDWQAALSRLTESGRTAGGATPRYLSSPPPPPPLPLPTSGSRQQQ